MNGLKNLTLDNNSLKCDCGMKDLLLYVKENPERISRLENITCEENNNIYLLSSYHLNCVDSTESNIDWSFLYYLLIIIPLIKVIFIIAYYCCYKFNVCIPNKMRHRSEPVIKYVETKVVRVLDFTGKYKTDHKLFDNEA